MKIGLFSNLYPPHARGGAELVASRIADELYRRGHDVFVVSTTPFDHVRSYFPRITERDLAVVYRYFPVNVYHLTNAEKKPFMLRALWQLVDLFHPSSRVSIEQILEVEQPDVILTHNVRGMGMQLLRAIQSSRARHIHTLHDVQLSIPSGLLIRGQEQSVLNQSFLRRWYEKRIQRLFGHPDALVSPSTFLKDFYQERGFWQNDPWLVLPNPVPEIRVVPRVGSPTGRLRLMFVGQLEPHKGVDQLLALLDDPEREIEIHVAGDGSMRSLVRAREAKDKRLTYHGYATLDHLMQIMSLAEVMVVPSICYENSPTVIYEAFLAGMPVIASDVGGIPELIEEGKNGILFDPLEKTGLVEAIERYLADRQGFWDREDIIMEQAKEFHLGQYVDQLETLFEA